jgi:hypothetical protein
MLLSLANNANKKFEKTTHTPEVNGLIKHLTTAGPAVIIDSKTTPYLLFL